MATQASTVEYIIDQLASVPNVSARKMFGEYALYASGKVVGLICDDTLFVKITEAGKKFMGDDYAEGFAYPGAKASMKISDDYLEGRERIAELIALTQKNLPVVKPKKKKNK